MATPLQNFVEWAPSTTDGPAAVAVFARAVEQQVILRFVSEAARDAAFTAAAVSPAGCVCRLDTQPGLLFLHDGTAWVMVGTASTVQGAAPIALVFTTGTPDLTSTVTVAAKPYPQMVVAQFAGMVTFQANDPDVVGILLYRGGVNVRGGRGYGDEFSVSGAYIFTLAASESADLKLVASKIFGSSQTNVTSDARYTYLTITAEPAS